MFAYWESFEKHFLAALEEATVDEFRVAWKSEKERTCFYKEIIATRIAASMNMQFTSELFKVDFALCATSTNGHLVPLIFVESENKANTATHEVRKLCSLSAPLKVLITCVEWCEESGYWRSGGSKTKLLSRWREIISAHNEVRPQECVYGIIVGEWHSGDGPLRFYSMAFNNSGELVRQEKIIFERVFG